MLTFTSCASPASVRLPDGQRCAADHRSRPGPVLEVLTLGATVHRLEVAGGDGVRRNVVLGHADVGRPAGELATTSAARSVATPTGSPAGGSRSTAARSRRRPRPRQQPARRARRLRPTALDVVEHEPDEVVLELVSPDGDQGFPGELTVRVALPGRRGPRAGRDGGDDGRPDRGQPDQPRLLQPRRRGCGHDRRPPAAWSHADEFTPGRRDRHPARRARAGRRHARSTCATPARDRRAVRAEHPQVVDARGIDHNYVVRGEGLRTHAVAGVAAHRDPSRAALGPAGAAGLHRQLPRRRRRSTRGRLLPAG